MSGKTTISDIARQAGVSRTTVSYFLSEKYENMSAETRERIQSAVSESGYQPNRHAQALKSAHTFMLGITVSDIGNSYTARILKGIMEKLKGTPYRTIILNSDYNLKNERNNIQQLVSEQVDGIIIQPVGRDSAEYSSIQGLPFVQVDRYVEPLAWPAVISDDYEKCHELTELILSKGYRRIIILSPPIEYSSARTNRLRGITSALEQSGVELKTIVTAEVRDLVAADIELWNHISAEVLDEVKTALFAFNGGLLYGTIKLLKQKGIAVPGQVGVVGYDDGALASLFSPVITSIKQSPFHIGYRAANELLRTIEDGDSKAERILVQSQLTSGESL